VHPIFHRHSLFNSGGHDAPCSSARHPGNAPGLDHG